MGSDTTLAAYRKLIKDIRAANACAEAVLWAWVRMGEIVNGQTASDNKGGRPRKNRITGDTVSVRPFAKHLDVSPGSIQRYQLAARLNEAANFDAHVSEYRDDVVGRNIVGRPWREPCARRRGIP